MGLQDYTYEKLEMEDERHAALMPALCDEQQLKHPNMLPLTVDKLRAHPLGFVAIHHTAEGEEEAAAYNGVIFHYDPTRPEHNGLVVPEIGGLFVREAHRRNESGIYHPAQLKKRLYPAIQERYDPDTFVITFVNNESIGINVRHGFVALDAEPEKVKIPGQSLDNCTDCEKWKATEGQATPDWKCTFCCHLPMSKYVRDLVSPEEIDRLEEVAAQERATGAKT